MDLVLGPSENSIRGADRLMAVWVALWVVLGALAGYQVWRLDQLGSSVVDSGNAVGDAGQVLEQLSRLPVVGEGAGRLGERVSRTGTDVVAGGRASIRSVHVLALELGAGTMLAGVAPVVLGYVPFRLRRRRRLAELGRRTTGGPDAALLEHLAHRAVAHLPYEALAGTAGNPYDDLRAGRYEALARAELARLGVGRSAPRRPVGSRE